MLPATTSQPLALTPSTTTVSPVDAYLYSVAEGSRRTLREALTAIARIVTGIPDASAYTVIWPSIRYTHAMAIRRVLEERYAYTTANKMLSSLRGVLKCCWQMGLMSGEDYYLARSVPPVRGSRLPAGREISQGELGALLGDCIHDRSVFGRRDAAILAVLYGCGVRREELARIRLGDYDEASGALRIQGKRNKERIVYVADKGAQEAVADWLAARFLLTTPTPDAPLFVHIWRSGRMTDEALSVWGVNDILVTRAQRASVPHLTPHDFRRTFVGDLLSAGADISTVARLAGHANVATTARYDRRPEEQKRAAASLLHVPYRRVV